MKMNSSSTDIFLSYAILFLILIFPLLVFKYPILIDYPNHIARFFILSNIDTDSYIKENYMVKWSINPYMIMEGFGGFFSRYMSVFTAGKLMIIIGVSLIFSGGLLLRKNITGRIDMWMAIALILIYNHVLYYGFLNYYASSGVALISMGIWIKLRHVSTVKHLLFFSAISLLLFFSHLFALGVYAVFVAGYEIGVYRYSREKLIVSGFIKAIAQFFLPFIFFIIWWKNLIKYETGTLYDYGDISEKFIALLSPFIFDLNEKGIYLVLFMLVSILIFRIVFPAKISIYDNMKMPLLFFLGLAIITPRSLSGVWEVDCRIPFILMMLFVASIKFNENEKNTVYFRRSIVVVAIIALCIKIYFITDVWDKVGKQYQEFESSLHYVSRGSKVITIQEEVKNYKGVDTIVYHHMTALSVIERSAFWSGIFTALTPIIPSASTAFIDSPATKQLTLSDLLNIKHENGYVYAKGAVVYWANWTQDFDYLISIRFDNLSVIDIKNVKLKFRGSFFDIYRIVH